MSKSKITKLENKVDNYKEKYEDLQKSNVLKIVFMLAGVTISFLASYLQFEMSGVDFKEYKFTGNVIHIIGGGIILLPWLKLPFTIKAKG